jgi:sulfide:quinone oxidoreductase
MLQGVVSNLFNRRRAAPDGPVTRGPEGHGSVPFRVVIVGGGVAAIETGLALRALAGDRVALQIVAPDPEFTYRPLEVREPFAGRSAPRFDLADLAEGMGAELIADRLARVAPLERRIFTEGGDALTYDALVLCLGATPVRSLEHARMIAPGQLDDLLHGFVQDVEGGYVRSAAFVVPDRIAWPLPLYELLLMTAERAAGMQAEIALTLVTSEPRPLDAFGDAASDAVRTRLVDAGIELRTSCSAKTPGNKLVDLTTADGQREQLAVDSVLALPELVGPSVDGLPTDAHGFYPVDEYGRVQGEDCVFGAGDGTDGAVKQGGVAAQQAEVVALGVAYLAGVAVEPVPLRPVMRGVLLTGGDPLVVGEPADLTATGGVATDADAPNAFGKIVAPRLTAYLAAHAPLPAGASVA